VAQTSINTADKERHLVVIPIPQREVSTCNFKVYFVFILATEHVVTAFLQPVSCDNFTQHYAQKICFIRV
jgi:hypothetical protein